MKSDKTVIIWIPNEGTGTIRSIRINPRLMKVFFFIAVFCIIAVPILQTGVIMLYKKVTAMRQHEEQLHDKIAALLYVEKNLAAVEEKDAMLRHYFGLEKYKSLEPIMIGGGKIDIESTAPGSTGSNTEFESLNLPASYSISLPENLKRLYANHEVLNHLIIKQEEARKFTPSIMPVDLKNPRISSDFGWRKNPFTEKTEFHSGIDIVGPEGTKIISPADGVVVTKGYDQWLGKYLVIQHTESIKTIYGHLDTIRVKKGDLIKRGQHLGRMGNTGMSTSRHLHYVVVVQGQVVDPVQYILNQHGAS